MRGDSNLRRVAVLALVVLVALQPAIGFVAASPDDGASTECYLRGLASLTTMVDVQQCETPSEDRAQTMTDSYAGGLAAHEIENQVLTAQENHINATRDLCWCTVKAEAIQHLKNGSNRSTALDAANDTVDTHYSRVQENILSSYNSQINYVTYIGHLTENTTLDNPPSTVTDDPRTPVHIGNVQYKDDGADGQRDANYTQVWWHDSDADDLVSNGTVAGTRNVTLVDGSNGSATVLHAENSGFGISYFIMPFQPMTTASGYFAEPQYDSHNIRVYKPQVDVNDAANIDEANSIKVFDTGRWNSTWQTVESEHDFMRTQAETYVNDLYDNHNASDFDSVNATELHSACSLAKLATDHQSTGYYGYARAEIALMGFNASVNDSFTARYMPADPSGEYRAKTVGNITFATNGTGHGAIVAPDDTITVDATGINNAGNVTNVEINVTKLDGTHLDTINATDATGDRWTFNLSSVNGTVPDGERVSLNLTATAENESATLSGIQMVLDPPGGGSGELLSGALYTDWHPAVTNGTFVTNQTYNTSNTDLTVYFLDQRSGDYSTNVELDGEFIITNMTNVRTGEAVNETTLQDYNHQTANTSLTLDEVQQLLDYRNDHDENYGSGAGGGGGGDGFNFDFGAAGFGFIAIAGGALLVLSNRS